MDKALWLITACGVAIAASLVLTLALVLVVEQRDDAVDQVEQLRVRLDEQRKVCHPRAELECTQMPGSRLHACNLSGSRFVWLTFPMRESPGD